MAALRVETLDTMVVPPADRFPLWVEIADRAAAPIALTSDHADDFRGRARFLSLGAIELTRLRYQSLVGRRTPRLIRQADPEVFQVALTLTGRSMISASRRESAIPVGDFTLIDWARPHQVEHAVVADGDSAAGAVTAVIPRALLPLAPDRVAHLAAARMPGSEGPGLLLARHLHHVTRHPEQFRATDAPHLADVTVSLVSALLARHLDVEDRLPADIRRQTLLSRIRDFIDQHLNDPALSPQLVADAHHISLRTLHRLFQAQEETVAGMIRVRRLHRCRRDLTDPLLRHQPVHLIARRWGFTDKAHFSRLFRAAYGMGPQAYRQRSPW
ncbi:AraC-like ligand-binding domain-containing protein [Micromonospora sp. LZ34]